MLREFFKNLNLNGNFFRYEKENGEVIKGTLNDLNKELIAHLKNEKSVLETLNTLEDGQISELVQLNSGKKAKVQRSGDLVNFYFEKDELQIPDRLLNHTLTSEEKELLMSGRSILITEKKKNYYLNIDRETNSIILRSDKDINMPSIVGANKNFNYKGDRLNFYDKMLIAEGKTSTPKLLCGENGYFMAEISITNREVKFTNIVSLNEKEAEARKQLVNLISGTKKHIPQSSEKTNKAYLDVIKFDALTEKMKLEQIANKGAFYDFLNDRNGNEFLTKFGLLDDFEIYRYHSFIGDIDFKKEPHLANRRMKFTATNALREMEGKPLLSFNEYINGQDIFYLDEITKGSYPQNICKNDSNLNELISTYNMIDDCKNLIKHENNVIYWSYGQEEKALEEKHFNNIKVKANDALKNIEITPYVTQTKEIHRKEFEASQEKLKQANLNKTDKSELKRIVRMGPQVTYGPDRVPDELLERYNLKSMVDEIKQLEHEGHRSSEEGNYNRYKEISSQILPIRKSLEEAAKNELVINNFIDKREEKQKVISLDEKPGEKLVKEENFKTDYNKFNNNLDSDFIKAINEDDFIKITEMSKEGYKPSVELIETLNLQDDKKIAVEKIFDIEPKESAQITKNPEKREKQKDKSNNLDKVRGIVNTLFQGGM